MSAYYRRGSGSSRRKHGGSCGFWFVAGVLIGLFTAGVAWFTIGPELTGVPGFSGKSPDSSGASATAVKSQAPRPRFDFYNILPEMEVVIPEEEIAADRPPQKTTPTQQKPDDARQDAVLLQVGSFRKPADAEKLKAQLALMGIEAWIQRVSIDNKHTFHRVRSGPYLNYKRLNEDRDQLRRNKLSSIVIKLKE